MWPLCLALSLNQRAVFDWDLLCLTSRFSIPVLTIIKWAVLPAGWRRKRFCARKREGEREEDSTDGLLTFWGAIRLGLCERGPLYPSIFQTWTVRNHSAFSSTHIHQAVFEVLGGQEGRRLGWEQGWADNNQSINELFPAACRRKLGDGIKGARGAPLVGGQRRPV